jgi:hypothetical protein
MTKDQVLSDLLGQDHGADLSADNLDTLADELKSALEYGDFETALAILSALTDYVDRATATVQAAAPLRSPAAPGMKSKRGERLLPGLDVWLKPKGDRR